MVNSIKQDEKISVIMATYNCADSVSKSIDSILNQSYQNWEFVICDDCSSDGTYEILENYKNRYPEKFIILRNEKNSRLAFSLNHCLKFANGKYIARMDGDDISEPDRFKIQLDFLKKNPQYQLVGTSMKIFDGEKVIGTRQYKFETSKLDLRFGPCFAHATIMTYKDVYDSLGGYTVKKRTQRGQDFDLWFKFFAKGYSGVNLSDTLYIVTEDTAAYKRKKYKYRVQATITALNGYRLVKMPLRYYIFAFKPLLSGLLPSKIRKKFKRV